MKKAILYSALAAAVTIYFILSLVVLPPNYLQRPSIVPQPTLDVELDKNKINLGETFEIKIVSNNVGDPADIQIVSVAFPDLTKLDDSVKITSYDFTQSPRLVLIGDELGSEYTGGGKIVHAKYPSIEAYSRPIESGSKYSMGLAITPETAGTFTIYVKSIILPHTDELSHYPQGGITDHQNEYVQVHTVEVGSN